MKISTIYDGYACQPINYMAASMLFKSNEWEQVDKPLRKFIEQITPKESLITIDYFKIPPLQTNPIKNRTGLVFIVGIYKYVVTGYAYARTRTRPKKVRHQRTPYLGQKPYPQWIIEHRHTWWCINLSTLEYKLYTSEKINKQIRFGQM